MTDMIPIRLRRRPFFDRIWQLYKLNRKYHGIVRSARSAWRSATLFWFRNA